jgi:hypothetical protein
MTLKIGDVVVYTPPGHKPVTDGFPRYVVLGPYDEGDGEDWVWVAEANPSSYSRVGLPHPELVGDLTKVEL